jgi:hypothetical protein
MMRWGNRPSARVRLQVVRPVVRVFAVAADDVSVDVDGSPTAQIVRGAPAKGIASGSSRAGPELLAAGHADTLDRP